MCICFAFSACQKECKHEYTDEILQEATCLSIGLVKKTCALCGESVTEHIDRVEHKHPEGTVTQEVTCVQTGIMTRRCIWCTAPKTETIPLAEHACGESYVAKEPNCIETGEKRSVCTVCGVDVVVDTIPTNDSHQYEEMVIRAATCTDPGEGCNTCARCGHSESFSIPLKNHSYGKGAALSAPSCTVTGVMRYSCSACGFMYEELISDTGHTWAAKHCTEPVTCSTCGYVDPDGLGHDYKPTESGTSYRRYSCTVCGKEKHNYYDATSKQEYDWDKIVEYANTYATNKGFRVVVSDSTNGSASKSKTFEIATCPMYGGVPYIHGEIEGMIDGLYTQASAGAQNYEFWVILHSNINSLTGRTYTIRTYICQRT